MSANWLAMPSKSWAMEALKTAALLDLRFGKVGAVDPHDCDALAPSGVECLYCPQRRLIPARPDAGNVAVVRIGRQQVLGEFACKVQRAGHLDVFLLDYLDSG